ncbi:hypothetical protein PILCRDRAFT_821658 [Piloderma croceum F 1598]|uniref:Uncharacterized protein n=1 Tax=Piloderma croceum (strain F 1598) TaxID=765440 RepID=A0A0C3FPU7_PILCF|nr:hypothetical protein PILCRDRAFT_821658 [Piloderma croceum F 1598]
MSSTETGDNSPLQATTENPMDAVPDSLLGRPHLAAEQNIVNQCSPAVCAIYFLGFTLRLRQ